MITSVEVMDVIGLVARTGMMIAAHHGITAAPVGAVAALTGMVGNIGQDGMDVAMEVVDGKRNVDGKARRQARVAATVMIMTIPLDISRVERVLSSIKDTRLWRSQEWVHLGALWSVGMKWRKELWLSR